MIKDVYTLTQTTINEKTGQIENRVEHTFSEEYLPTILDKMTYFLRGCSFVINEEATLVLDKE